jgi:hypothetical protein
MAARQNTYEEALGGSFERAPVEVELELLSCMTLVVACSTTLARARPYRPANIGGVAHFRILRGN